MQINLTKIEEGAVDSVLFNWLLDTKRRARRHQHANMSSRVSIINNTLGSVRADFELPTQEAEMSVVTEILYDFLVVETVNQVRELLSNEDLERLEVVRVVFAKILANAPVNGREMNIGSIYLAPAELVKIGLHKMLQFPEIELLHYARKADGGMLRVIAQFLWHRDYDTKDQETVH